MYDFRTLFICPSAACNEKFGAVGRDVKDDGVGNGHPDGNYLTACRRNLIKRAAGWVCVTGREMNSRSICKHPVLRAAILGHLTGAGDSRRWQRGPEQEGKDCGDDESRTAPRRMASAEEARAS